MQALFSWVHLSDIQLGHGDAGQQADHGRSTPDQHALMNHFEYRNGILHAEDVPLPEIAAAVGTPFYCYSTATLTRHFTVFSNAFAGMNALVCYAMKANSNIGVLATLASLGAGADVVSGGELLRALEAGIPANRIQTRGRGKRELLVPTDDNVDEPRNRRVEINVR